MIDSSGLMMIEPKGKRERAVHDHYTDLARKAQKEARSQGLCKGVHTCACGMRSDNNDWRVRGLVTNSLLLHYVRDHRSEVPASELAKLLQFDR